MAYPKNRKQKTIQERFEKHITKTDTCWNWTGATSESGYGVFQRGKRGLGLVRSHRYSYEQKNGKIPAGLLACHKCNNKLCCNPDHIYAGTYSENLKDAWRDGIRKRKRAKRKIQ